MPLPDRRPVSWRLPPRSGWPRRLLPGLPALVTGLAASWISAAALSRSPSELTARYRQEGERCLQHRDFAAASVCYNRLLGLTPDDPAALYGLALAAEGLGQCRRAEAVMAALTPRDRPGYAPAHLWWARRGLAGPSTLWPAAEWHLSQALRGNVIERTAAQGLLGRLFLAAGRLREAERHLTEAAAHDPQFRLPLAVVFGRQGLAEQAQREAQAAYQQFHERLQTNPADDEARIGAAEAALLLHDYPGAVELLRPGLGETAAAAAYRSALVRVYLTWSQAQAQDRHPVPGGQVALLEKALATDPSSQEVVDRLVVLASQGNKAGDARASSTQLAEAACGVLQRFLKEGRNPSAAHAALGNVAWQRGRHAEALQHWEEAFRLNPRAPLLANNLAWGLAHAPTPDLPRALQLAEHAVRLAPADPRFRGTRGHILAKLGRWQEAVVDLELALASYAGTPKLHQALATVYRQLNMPAAAAAHQRRALQAISKSGLLIPGW